MSSPSTEGKQSQQAQRAGKPASTEEGWKASKHRGLERQQAQGTGPAHIPFAINISTCLRKPCLFSLEAGDSSTQTRPVPHVVSTPSVLRGAMRKGQTLSQMPLLSQKYHFR